MCRFWSAITDQEPEVPLPCSTVVKSARLTDAVLGGRGPRAARLHPPAGSDPGGLSSGLPEEGRRQMGWERGSGGRKRKSWGDREGFARASLVNLLPGLPVAAEKIYKGSEGSGDRIELKV